MRALVIGGRGFIGSHLVKRLENDGHEVDEFDLIDGLDARNTENLTAWLGNNVDTVFHLASNPDIAAAVRDPMIDFDNGTVITASVVDACHRAGVQRIVYASGSGVYGDHGTTWLSEDYGPLMPTSPYGASKLAGEAMISAYCHMFAMQGVTFRFANVVGPDQTHGVGFDFMNRLRTSPKELRVLGDGNQSKSYVHVTDVIDAMMIGLERATKPYDVFNVATEDFLTVRDIAETAMSMRTRYMDGKIIYDGGRKGWAGDIPVVRLNTDKIRALGWANKMTSFGAMLDALRSMA